MHLSRRRLVRNMTSVFVLSIVLTAVVICSFIIAELHVSSMRREFTLMCAPRGTVTQNITVPPPSPQTLITEASNAGFSKEEESRPCRVVAGQMRDYKGFLTIGVPTVSRHGTSYLFKTLDSMIENTSEADKKSLVIVVFMADTDDLSRSTIFSAIDARYGQYIIEGLMLVVEPVLEFYPTFDNLPSTFNDPETRVRWRSKQVVDFAYLISFCRSLSDFYMTLEDDVITTPEFLPAIGAFINEQDKPWVMLEFSTVGAIGKLYKSRDLERLADFLLLFYGAQPLDFLLIYFRLLNTQMKAKLRTPTLFQHIGLTSSLENKTQPIKDKLFEPPPPPPLLAKKGIPDNPPATILSTMPVYENHREQLPYELQPTDFFWTSRPVEKGDFYNIMFHQATRLDRVVVTTGSVAHPDDFLVSGDVEISVETEPPWNVIEPCSKYEVIGTFVRGRADISDLSSAFPRPAKCLRIIATGSQNTWLIISDVSIYLALNNTSSV